MEEVALSFMPYPHVYRGERRDGALISWPERCTSCDRQCEASTSKEIDLCSYGVNYVHVDPDVLIAGVSVRGWAPTTKNYRTQLRRAGSSAVERSALEAIRNRATAVADAVSTERGEALARIVDEYRTSEAYKRDSVELMRPDIEQSLAQIHDYRSLITQIIQNVNVLLQEQLPGVDIDEQLRRSPEQLQSIYWAARLMEFKLQGPLFLMYPDRIRADRRIFRLHGAVLKYLRLYQAAATHRGINIRLSGESHSSLCENPDAVGVIYHAFIDNALKYAPNDTEIVVGFAETNDHIVLSVSSVGPRISKDERTAVFGLYQRGRHAVERNLDGTGLGLGMAQHIANEIDALLDLEQSETPTFPKPAVYRTVFTATFKRPRSEDLPSRLERQRVRTRGGPSRLIGRGGS